MCNHPPEKITFYQGQAFIDPYSKDVMATENVWVCECGASFDHDPANDMPEDFELPLDLTDDELEDLELPFDLVEDEPEENMRKELASEWM